MSKKYNLLGGPSTASIYNTAPKAAPGLFFRDLNNGNGTCWRGTFNDDGTPIGVFYGTWASGTDECRLAVAAPQNNSHLMISSTGGATTVTATSGEDYFKNSASMQYLQLTLVKAGVLNASQVTGSFTPDTFLAIKAFQTKYNIPVTGYPNAATVKILNTVPLR